MVGKFQSSLQKKISSLHVPLIHKRAPRRECDIEINRFSKTVFTDGVIHVPPIHKWTPTSECDIETNWFSETLFTDGIN